MLVIEYEPWRRMLEHTGRCYPEEACGAMLGTREDELRRVRAAVELTNVWPGSRRTRYRVDPRELLEVERTARERGWELLGIYHSHPDEDPYFSRTDLQEACPWYCYLVLSIRSGRFTAARCWQPNDELTSAAQVPFCVPGAASEEEKCQGS